MKIISYEELSKTGTSTHAYEEARAILKKAQPILTAQFNISSEQLDRDCGLLRHQIQFLLHVAGTLEGKTILDLGCGCDKGGFDNRDWNDRMFEPWLCRALSAAGYKIIGIDDWTNTNPTFECYRRDLLRPDALNDIADSSIDVVHAGNLLDSPYMEKLLKENPLEEDLLLHLVRLAAPKLKEDGAFLYKEE